MVRSLLPALRKSWIFRVGRKAIPFICLLILGTDAIAQAAAPAPAAVPTLHLDVPAATLEKALRIFAAQSGVSVGMSGRMPQGMVRALRGDYTALVALQMLLQDSALQAVQVNPRLFRLQPRVEGADSAAATAAPEELAEVLVTANKREQSWMTAPLSLAIIDGSTVAEAAVTGGSRAAWSQDASSSSTNIGSGRNRQFIRGVADSAFLGPSQATVSVQFDETRLNYSAPDPDLRLVDVARVEILKGPQGPLYGTGALGGVFHVVPRRPQMQQRELHTATYVAGVEHGGVAPGAEVVANLPLVPGRWAVRGVAYAGSDSGWIDTDGRSNANSSRIRGARLSLRGVIRGEWVLDLQGVAQSATARDSQYQFAPGAPMRRSGVSAEPRDNDLYLAAATLNGQMAGAEATFTTSYVFQEASGVLDASESAQLFGITPPARYADNRHYRVANSELRLHSGAGALRPWLIGAAVLSAKSRNTGRISSVVDAPVDALLLAQHTRETALFGEVSVPLGERMHATAGARLSRVATEDEASAESAARADAATRAHTLTPSLSLDWRSADLQRFYYLRYAQAIRPGGLNPLNGAAAQEFSSDRLANLDIGTRLRIADVVLMQSSLFVSRWRDVQSDSLLPNGLVGTRNVGNAANVGVEGAVQWNPREVWHLEGGMTFQHARLRNTDVAIEQEDLRLPVVPDLRLHAAILRRFHVASWVGGARIEAEYNGASRLSFEPALNRRTAGYAKLGAGVELSRGAVSWSLRVDNLLDSHADTFAFGNPFSIRTRQQFTPLRPRTVTLRAAWNLP
jgi:outer membrane receptor protein involved in Fe transport